MPREGYFRYRGYLHSALFKEIVANNNTRFTSATLNTRIDEAILTH